MQFGHRGDSSSLSPSRKTADKARCGKGLPAEYLELQLWLDHENGQRKTVHPRAGCQAGGEAHHAVPRR